MTGANSSQHTTSVQHALNQNLHPAAGVSHPVQARLDNAGIVKNDHVAWAQIQWEVRKHPVLQCAAYGVEMQHAAVAPLLGRKLRNQFRGKVEVEILNFHCAYYTGRRNRGTVAAAGVFSDNAPPEKEQEKLCRDGGIGRRT